MNNKTKCIKCNKHKAKQKIKQIKNLLYSAELEGKIDIELEKLERTLFGRVNQIFQASTNGNIVEGTNILLAFYRVMKFDVAMFKAKLKTLLRN